MTRALAAMMLVTACDLRAAPKAPPRDAQVAISDAATPADADLASLCMAAANHVAEVLIAEGDQVMRSEVTQTRGRMVQTIASGCTNEHWSDGWVACTLKATDRASIDRCRK